MSFLVVSHQHELIPFAYRLKHQGHNTQLLVCSERFEKAWEGKFDHFMPAADVNKENLEPTLEMAKRGEVTVLSDNRSTSRMFEGVETFYGICEMEEYPLPRGPLRFGGWFNGEEIVNQHVIVCDEGAWPGGLGPQRLGGLTLIRLSDEHSMLLDQVSAGLMDLWRSKYKFQGLVQIGIEETAQGEVVVQGVQCGWPTLQSHAFVSELEDFAGLLAGDSVELPQRVVVVVPISIPPWPVLIRESRRKHESREGPVELTASRPVEGLTPKQVAQVFWHDVVLNTDDKTISSGGLDGLLGVARGAAGNVALARARAVGIAAALRVDEKQCRPDVGALVDQALAGIETRFGIVP